MKRRFEGAAISRRLALKPRIRLSSRTRLYLHHASDLIQHGHFRELIFGTSRTLNRVLSKYRMRLMRRIERSSPLLIKNNTIIDAKHSRLTLEGGVVEKTSIVFPSPSAPLLATIVIPCFNYGRYLMEAVTSALNQTVRSLEIIVVDDGSTDPETHNVLLQVEQIPRVRVVRQNNSGLPSARNAGIALAQGEYICCLDADDILEPTYIELAIATMEVDRTIGFAYSWVQLFGDETTTWRTRDFDLREAMTDNHTSVAAVFRRDDWIAAGGYRPSMRDGYEDWEFWLRLAALGRRGRVLRTPLFKHRRHGRTMTHDAHAKRRLLIETMRKHNPAIFDNPRLRRKLSNIVAPVAARDPLQILRRSDVCATYDSRPHLLVILPWLADGGAEVLLLEVLEKLSTDWRISIVTSRPDHQPWHAKFSAITTDIIPLFGAFEEQSWDQVIDYLIATRGTKVVLSQGCTFAYENVASLKRRHPTIVTVDILHNDLATGHLRNAVSESESIDVHVAISSRISRTLKFHGVSEKKITTIVNGVNTEAPFNPDLYDRSNARDTLDLPHGIPVVLWVGRISEEKRPHEFISLIKRLATQTPVVGLMIGDGPLAGAIDKSIVELRKSKIDIRRIAQLPRQDIAKCYAAADMLVLTSLVEGLPFVALEALATGCPVATTNVGDLASIIRPNETGFLVPSDRPGDLADILANVLTEPIRLAQLRANARQFMASSDLSLDRMLSAYQRLFAQLLEVSRHQSNAAAPASAPKDDALEHPNTAI